MSTSTRTGTDLTSRPLYSGCILYQASGVIMQGRPNPSRFGRVSVLYSNCYIEYQFCNAINQMSSFFAVRSYLLYLSQVPVCSVCPFSAVLNTCT